MKHTRAQLNSIKSLMLANQNKEEFYIRTPDYYGFSGSTREDIFFVLDESVDGLSINFKGEQILFEEDSSSDGRIYVKYYSVVPVDENKNICAEDECYDYDYILNCVEIIN